MRSGRASGPGRARRRAAPHSGAPRTSPHPPPVLAPHGGVPSLPARSRLSLRPPALFRASVGRCACGGGVWSPGSRSGRHRSCRLPAQVQGRQGEGATHHGVQEGACGCREARTGPRGRAHHAERLHRPGGRAADDRRHGPPADLRHDPGSRIHGGRPRGRDLLHVLLLGALRARRAARARGPVLRDGRAGTRDAPADPAAVGASRWRQELGRGAAQARPRGLERDGRGRDLRARGLPDARGAAAPRPVGPARPGPRPHRRDDRRRAVPGLPVAPGPGVRRRLPELPDRAHRVLRGRARRDRDVRAGRPEVDERRAAHRRPRFPGDRAARLRLAPAGAGLGGRVLQVQPRRLRGGRVLQEPRRVPQPLPDDGPGEAVQGGQVRLHRLRHRHRRPHQRGGVPRVHGRPEERGAQGPPRHGRRALQRARRRRGADLLQAADRSAVAGRPARRARTRCAPPRWSRCSRASRSTRTSASSRR